MRQDLDLIVRKLRGTTSEHAADWLLYNYPIENPKYGEVFIILPHLSWKKEDQLRLARYYLQLLPFAHSRPYKAFATFMSTSNFIKVLELYIPQESDGKELFAYYIFPVLKSMIQNEKEEKVVQEFISRLKY